MNWKPWLYGLISAFVGGGANVVATAVIEPDVLTGLQRVASLWAVSGAISAALYLKQSPLPSIVQSK